MGDLALRRRPLDRVGSGGPPSVARARLVFLLAGVLVVAGALVPAGYGLADRPSIAFKAGLFLSGSIAVVSSLSLVFWWTRTGRPHRSDVFRPILGLSVLCWGIGQLSLGVESLIRVLTFPAVGDVIGSFAAPIALIAMICLPRSSATSWPGLRLGLDAIVTGGTLTYLLWRTILTTSGKAFTSNSLSTEFFVMADCATLAVVVLTAVRDPRSRILPAVLGLLCHLIADVNVILAGLDGGARVDSWFGTSLWCLAWPLICLGVARFRPSRGHQGRVDDRQDRREVQSTQLATIFTFGLIILVALVGRRPDGMDEAGRGSLVLILILVPMMWLREMVSTQLRLRLTASLRAEAFRDSLTGLPNRSALTDRIAELESSPRPWIVLTLGLDGFKQVNDLLGHHAGDDLLTAVADTLRKNCPPDLLIARIGGDEFAVLSPGDLTEGGELAERLRKAVRGTLDLHAPGFSTSASVGVGRLVRPDPRGSPGLSGFTDHGHRDRLNGLVESAAALRAAKEGGRDAVEIYDGDMAAARERRIQLEHRLRHAISSGAVRTFGQPIVALDTGRLTGFESLARWTDEELGPVPPDEFINVAEQTGLVVALGEHLLAETLSAANEAGVFAAGLTLSVNASPIQLRVPGFVDLMRYQLARLRISPELVIVEITEAILVADGDPALHALSELHALGVGLAIDDFGTGYSALGYLRKLPVQVLKIDKSLTSSLLTEAKTVAIVEGVIRMAHRMGIRVVMEGIEDELEADSCRAVAADRGQGWLFGRPIPWDQAADMVRTLSHPTAQTLPVQRPVPGVRSAPAG